MKGGARLRGALPGLVSAAAVALAARAWWATAASTSDARIAAMSTVEPYAFAVYEQLLRNFAEYGRFAQVIHRGYEDSWAWSGHRALTLPLAGWLYGLRRSAFHLAGIQVGLVLLGVVPAALVGRRALRSGWGLALGGLLYLASPAVMALALQDYQDLVLALPALAFAWWAGGSGRPWLWALGALVGLSPREECIPLAALAVALAPPARPEGRWRRLARAATGAAVAGGVVVALRLLAGDSPTAHDVPAEGALGTLLGLHGPVHLDGWPHIGDFYALLARPVGPVALLAPEAALPALALVGAHMTVPAGHGVDRSWFGHAHHMAPAAAFAALAAIEGSARLLRWTGGGGRPAWRRALAVVLGLAVLGAAAAQVPDWTAALHLRASPWARLRPTWWHPAWVLARHIPADAVPIASSKTALAISSWPRAYTWDESLDDKAPGRGLAAGTHLLVDRRSVAILGRALRMDGARVLAEERGFVLVGWAAGARDPGAGRPVVGAPLPVETVPGRPARIPGVPPPREMEPPPRGVPVIRLPWTPERVAPPRIVPRGPR